MNTIYTVSKEALMHEASAIEQSAQSSLQAWILLGQSERYTEEMTKAQTIRNAAAQRSIHIRREILRNLGYEFKKI